MPMSIKRKSPTLDALVASHQANPNMTDDERLVDLTNRLPSIAAAPINSAGPMPSAAAIASEIVIAQAAAAAASKFLTKAEFDQLSSQAKGDFFRSGGKLVEAAPPPIKKSTTPGIMALAEFQTLTPQARMAFMNAGGKLEA